MRVFVLGITGAVGGLLADRLVEAGDTVWGLVRSEQQREALAARGVETVVGDLAELSASELAAAFRGSDVIVFSAGSNGGARSVTTAIDGHAVSVALDAAHRAGVGRFVLVSVMPESWRERELSDDEEYYFAVKKQADVAVSRSDLDWVILRPALLTDEEGTGRVSLGPAEVHEQIARADVAAVLAALVHEPRVRRRILELNSGSEPVEEALAAVVARL